MGGNYNADALCKDVFFPLFKLCDWIKHLQIDNCIVGGDFNMPSAVSSTVARFAMGKSAKRKTTKSTPTEQSPNKSLKKKLAFVSAEAEEIDVDTNPLPQPTNVVQDKVVNSEVIEDDDEDGNNALIASNIQLAAENYMPEKVMFVVSTCLCNGEETLITDIIKDSWDPMWLEADMEFEKEVSLKRELKFMSKKMFFVWEGNHRTKAWMEVITELFKEDKSRRVRVMCTLIDPRKVPEIALLASLQRMNVLNEHAVIKPLLRDVLINTNNICGSDTKEYIDSLKEEENKEEQREDTLRKEKSKIQKRISDRIGKVLLCIHPKLKAPRITREQYLIPTREADFKGWLVREIFLDRVESVAMSLLESSLESMEEPPTMPLDPTLRKYFDGVKLEARKRISPWNFKKRHNVLFLGFLNNLLSRSYLVKYQVFARHGVNKRSTSSTATLHKEATKKASKKDITSKSRGYGEKDIHTQEIAEILVESDNVLGPCLTWS
ncbi:hypothetical protein GOP47_0023636 [Adiantum capillus-veneris]|uniref:Uncharacterized protein n=1 Tax=Adiantum capillus-veneris TaxID=13818 RepID=A0A9D4U3V4_ADICA|nr:hypothetical protein GOP47_0023636 [Adiantum capillus-veneris]